VREILAKSYWIQVLLLMAAYTAVGRLSLLLAVPAEILGTIWPPSGIALAALLLGGRRLWPGVWLGSVAVVLSNAVRESGPGSFLPGAFIVALLGAGASLQAVVGASLVRRFTHGRNPLDRQRDVLALLFWGGFVGCSVGSTLGSLVLSLSQRLDLGSSLFAWGTWWAGDTIGTLIVTPVVLLWAERRPAWLRRRLSVTIPMAATLAIVLLLFLFASRREEEELRAAFVEQAQDFGSVLRSSCEDHLEALHSMTLVLSMLPAISPQDFQAVVAGVLEHRPGIQALSWNPRVDRAGRAAFERSGAGLPITERDAQGMLRPAAPRPYHVPVLFIAPLAANERALGFDVAWHTGTVPQQKRRLEIDRFKRDPECRLLLSTDSGSVGLNLQVASAVVNAAYLAYDAAWFKSVCQIGVTAIGLVAAIRTWQVFPFDFSPYDGPWATLTRLLLVLAIFGSIVGIGAELARLAGRRNSTGVRSQTLHR